MRYRILAASAAITVLATACAASSCTSKRPPVRTSRRRTCLLPARRTTDVATPELTSVVIPAFNEGPAVAEVVRALAGAGRWHEIIVVDDGSADDTAERARAAGATVVRHPYNKGNGAAVKSGIRHAAGEFVLIVDGDGQHRAADAARIVARLGEYDLVIGARSTGTQATHARLMGNAALNWLAGYLTGRTIPDLTSGFRGARRSQLREFLHLLPNGFSTPTTTTLAFIKAGYNVRFEPIEERTVDGEPSLLARAAHERGTIHVRACFDGAGRITRFVWWHL